MNAFGIHFLIIWRCFTIANVKKDDLLINDQIKVNELMVIGPNGEQLGTKALKDALTLASYAGLDLVLMNPGNERPVGKIMDYNKHKYEKQKRAKEALKTQRANNKDMKEYQLSVTIDIGDFNTRKKNAENNGKGLNLSVQVLDGILCHNGELELQEYRPKKKTTEDFLNDYNNCYNVPKYVKTLVPMTLEGCVVRLSDIIAYLGRDIEDAEKLGLFNKKDIPKEISDVLGTTNREIINAIITNVVQNSLDKDYICVDDKIFNAIVNLKKFNYENIYDKIYTNKELDEIKYKFEYLFDNLLISLKEKDLNSKIYSKFYLPMNNDYKNNTSNERVVIDYIAGMTDEYFLNEYKHYELR